MENKFVMNACKDLDYTTKNRGCTYISDKSFPGGFSYSFTATGLSTAKLATKAVAGAAKDLGYTTILVNRDGVYTFGIHS